MTSELSRALTPAEVVSVIVLLVGPALGAAACGIFLLEQPGVLRLVELEGYFHADLEPWRPLPLDVQFPIAEAARRKESKGKAHAITCASN